MYKTLKLRIKDMYSDELITLANECNIIWNYTQNLCVTVLDRESRWLSAYDVAKYTGGCKGLLTIHAQTIQSISEEYCLRRKQFKRRKLNWRVSNKNSSKRSLGWIPFKKDSIKVVNGKIRYGKKWFSFWDSYGNLEEYDIKSGSFVEDARGRWYVCLVVKVEPKTNNATSEIGIDLGLKDLATTSKGEVITNNRYFKKYQSKLAIAQRSKNKKRTRALHAKIANSRRDYLQKETTKLVKDNGMIIVGNLSATALIASGSGKSVNDSGFAACRTMLRYKCQLAGVWYEEVSERYTTQTCSSCGCNPPTSPKGRAGLGIREWLCVCGMKHQRDINAARNILALGHQRLVEGIPKVEDVNVIFIT